MSVMFRRLLLPVLASLAVAMPALAESTSPAWAPYAAFSGKLMWGGIAVDALWAGKWDDHLVLGGKGTIGVIGSGPGLFAGPVVGWRFPLGGGTAIHTELGATVGYGQAASGPLAVAATTGGVSIPSGWNVAVEPLVRYEWHVAPDVAIGLQASCLFPLTAFMPMPAIGVSFISDKMY